LAWRIEFSATAKKQLHKMGRVDAASIARYLRQRIATDEDPRRFGDPLRKELAGLWKYRVGDWRIICDIQDGRVTVLVLRVGHRSQVYRTP
jgi:mRNA interferase RelE/StbE